MHTRAEWEQFSGEPNAGLWRDPELELTELFDKDWLLHLAKRLQKSLHLEALIQAYAEEAGSVIPFDHITYDNRARKITLEFGEPARHICTYRLMVLEQELGTLTYTRTRPFSRNDTLRLEYLTSHLLFPLRRYLVKWTSRDVMELL